MGVGGGDGVRIHPQHLRPGEQVPQFLLHPLGAGAHKIEQSAAGGTRRGQGLGVAAVVAHETVVGRVVGQLYRTSGALGHLPALPAGHHPAGPPAVQEQDGLLPPLEILRQLPAQDGADGPGVALAQLLLQIHHQHLGQGPLVVACFQLKQPDLPLFRLIHGLHRRGGRAQHQQGIILHAAVLCHIPGMVAGDILRFVAGLLFLVQNDEAQIVQGGKDRRPGADDHLRLPPAGPLPLVVPLPRPEGAVEHRHLTAEMGGEAPQQLGGQHDLGHQHQSGPAPVQRLLDQTDVHLGLAAARHAVEQGGGGSLLPGQGVQPLEGRLLFPVEYRRQGRLHILQRGPAQHLLHLQSENPAFFQRLERLGRRPGKVT